MNVERNAVIYQRYQNGESIGVLAIDYEVTRQAIDNLVRREAKRRGEVLRKGKRGNFGLVFELNDEQTRSYLTGKISLMELRIELGCSKNTLYRCLKQKGVEFRSRCGLFTKTRNKDVAEKLLAGYSAQELAEEYRTTKGCIYQWIDRHRKRTGDKRRVYCVSANGKRLKTLGGSPPQGIPPSV